MPFNGKRRRGKQGKASAISVTAPPPPVPATPSPHQDLILTSEKRRGVFECDSCHTDISQLPRARCAVCPDFDWCLECFADPRVRHDETHGYRVCDSTRFPLFPTGRRVFQTTSSTKATDSDDAKSSTADDEVKTEQTDEAQDEKSEEEKNEKMSEDKASEDAMEIDEEEKSAETKQEPTAEKTEEAPKTPERPTATGEPKAPESVVTITEEPKHFWTAEEDLRLLEGIRAHGLGNWGDIAEAVSGQGSTGKTPKRCMERYFDDYLGQYGHILPQYTLIQCDEDEEMDPGDESKTDDEDAPRSSKRRALLPRSPSVASFGGNRKRYKAVPTESIEDYQELWPKKHLIDGVEVGQEVGRDQAYKAEQTFVRLMAQAATPAEAAEIRKEWETTRLHQPGGPTVLPARIDDVITMEGSELAGFMPRRGDFDVEWDNDAEQAVADMEFLPGEPEQDRELKLQVLAIYNSRLNEREKRKKFVLSRKLYDYRKKQGEDLKLPRDERDLVSRMRLLERFHTPEEHRVFLEDLLRAKRLRKEIAKLQMYRRIGIRSVVEAEEYELDKARRAFHKTAAQQKEAEAKRSETGGAEQTTRPPNLEETASSSLWKQYRTTDRKVRKSINRGASDITEPSAQKSTTESTKSITESNPEPSNEAVPMEIDGGNKDGASVAETTKTEATETDANEQPKPEEAKPEEGKQENTSEEAQGDAKQNPDGKKPVESEATQDWLARSPGYSLLSNREIELCRTLQLLPNQYAEIKRAIIYESLAAGLGDKRTVLQLDATKKGNVIDFMVRAGWISTKFAQSTKTGAH